MASSCPHLRSYRAATLARGTSVFKEECSQCFNNQDDASGISVCLHCFNPECDKHGSVHAAAKAHPLALVIKRTPVQAPEADAPAKITKLAIGVAGGAEASEQKYTFSWHVRCFVCNFPEVSLFDPAVTPAITSTASSIMAAESGDKRAEVKAWELEIEACQHTRQLDQLARDAPLAGKSLATCNECSINSNLWLCLACGHLGCGRRNYDGTGGNNHAVDHFASTKHGVVCKMGTITAEGTADIYCYTCDETRLDPHLAQHLRHFGIELGDRQVTEKTTTELQLERNLKFDFSMTTVDGKPLTPVYGNGLTGLENLGNSCYMASVMQVIFSLPTFRQTYCPPSAALEHRLACQQQSHLKCFPCQMEKLAEGLWSGKYSVAKPAPTPVVGAASAAAPEAPPVEQGIRPLMFKSLIGADHPEFATMRQQDALEFFQYFCTQLEQQERVRLGTVSEGRLPSYVFDFTLEERLQCQTCHGVRYSRANSNLVSVPLVPSTTTSKDPKKLPPMPKERATFDESIALFTADEMVEFRCPTCGQQPAGASKRQRFLSTPEVLVLNAKRFVYEDWVPRKLDIDFQVPETIDLSAFLAGEHAADEHALPEGQAAAPASAPAGPQFDAAIVSQLQDFGFPVIRAQKAALAVQNAGVEPAMNWLLEHMEDPDIDTPLVTASAPNPANVAVDENQVSMLADMGFSRAQAIRALKETGGNAERAVDWLFSHPDVTGDEVAMDTSDGAAAATALPVLGNQRKPVYHLAGLVTHKGPSVHSGHYVAHVLKDGQWVFFNDNKVALDPSPPVGAAYMYIFIKE
ncbi:ubiquitin carboxyl-terminal hydrolase ubp14 [Capsaspora owczarzaki ATCC 30864]|uniref:Ubiquitin carboxyl-terminal hydrolase n=1 Tax=Capsaspora owczarzaki (strain ATCC 30864) TaxID=595528 RepID=A0A0D2UBU1_CAPO3|nr:ubiquitin carboxyl-terminal hydrolase ubp14 [Capsaspora owczarzaki ATCC 30864]